MDGYHLTLSERKKTLYEWALRGKFLPKYDIIIAETGYIFRFFRLLSCCHFSTMTSSERMISRAGKKTRGWTGLFSFFPLLDNIPYYWRNISKGHKPMQVVALNAKKLANFTLVCYGLGADAKHNN